MICSMNSGCRMALGKRRVYRRRVERWQWSESAETGRGVRTVPIHCNNVEGKQNSNHIYAIRT
jgi:hypothetical protein